MNAVIVHGSFGCPAENWFPWLKEELEKLGCTVFVPRFPTPEKQNLKNWLTVFAEYAQYLDKDTILIGHSLGCAFILNALEGIGKQIKAAFFVAGFTGNLNEPEFDEINSSFADKEFDWVKIRKNCRQFFVFYSDNDQFVPQRKALDLAEKLNIKPILVKGAGHFNEKAGYAQFPLLLEKIKKLAK